jgi:hypothetical protein
MSEKNHSKFSNLRKFQKLSNALKQTMGKNYHDPNGIALQFIKHHFDKLHSFCVCSSKKRKRKRKLKLL